VVAAAVAGSEAAACELAALAVAVVSAQVALVVVAVSAQRDPRRRLCWR
jgi:hypothetical protein